MSTVTVYYQKCPKCGQTWSAQLSQASVIRIGKEVFVCKCGTEWPTGRVEWITLSPEKRRAYFFSEAEIGVLAICTIVPALFGYFIGNGWRSALTASGWGLLAGLTLVVLLWGMKLAIVSASRFRTRPQALTNGSHPKGSAFENPSALAEEVEHSAQPSDSAPDAPNRALRLAANVGDSVGSHLFLLGSVIIGFSIAMLLTLPFLDDGDYWLWGTGILGTALSTGLYLQLTKPGKTHRRN